MLSRAIRLDGDASEPAIWLNINQMEGMMFAVLRGFACMASCVCSLLLIVTPSHAEDESSGWVSGARIVTNVSADRAGALYAAVPTNDDDNTLVFPEARSRDIFDPVSTGSIVKARSDFAVESPWDEHVSTLVPAWN